MADAKKKWVIAKNNKFGTVAGGLGGRPKVYTTVKAAQFDLESKPKFKGGVIRPYTGVDGTDVASGAPLTTAATKAATAKAVKATNAPKRAAAGK